MTDNNSSYIPFCSPTGKRIQIGCFNFENLIDKNLSYNVTMPIITNDSISRIRNKCQRICEDNFDILFDADEEDYYDDEWDISFVIFSMGLNISDEDEEK